MGTNAFFAGLPILIILVLMLGLRWSAARAGVVGLGAALVLAWSVFGFGRLIYDDVGPVAATGGALLEALFTAATILWIIFPALALHQLQMRTGAIEVVRQAMSRLADDPRLLVILIAWFFALFIEGAAGFGATIALAAPLLVGIGFRPVEAVTLVLIGHSVGASFGAVGTPIVPQMEATGLSGQALARATGLYHSLLGWIMAGIVMLMVTRSPSRREQRQTIWGWTLLAAVCFLLPFFFISYFVGPELPTLGGALIGGVVFIIALRLARPKPATAPAEPAAPGDLLQMSLLGATAPYLILIVLVLLTRLAPPVQQALFNVAWQWSLFERFSGLFRPFYQPGTLLFLALLLGALWQRATAADMRQALSLTLRRLGPVTIALVAMLGLSRIMVHAGMISSLALTAAESLGSVWPLFAPFVGVLGTFVTGSATASNILFTDFQQATAQTLDLPVLALVGAQGFGAAVGNIICPHNIIAGGATVGLSGREGEILRGTLLACAIYAGAGGLMALLVAS